MLSARPSHQTFFVLSALLFLASTGLTIHLCSPMAMMDAMPMPGGWSMSMAWMPAQNGPRAMLSFLGMWLAMMVAMMLPSLVPMLWRYRKAVGSNDALRLDYLTAVAGAGYFLVWLALGIIAFPIGVEVAALAMQYPAFANAVPIVTGVAILLVGLFQFTAWKSHQLACCRAVPPRNPSIGSAAALRHGLGLGFHCVACCFNLTLLLLVLGIMDWRLMVVVTVAMTAERLAGERLARAIGVVVAAAGLFVIARAAGMPI